MHTTAVIIRSFHGKCKMINGYESPEGASGSRPIIHARRPYQPPASSPVHAPLMSRRRRNTTCCWPQAKRMQPHVRSIPQSPQTHSKHRCNIQHGAKPRTAQPGSSSTLAYQPPGALQSPVAAAAAWRQPPAAASSIKQTRSSLYPCFPCNQATQHPHVR